MRNSTRPDYLCDPAEVAEAFEKLQKSGKVRYFGVSNFRPTLVTACCSAACPMPLVVHQVEISLLARLDCLHRLARSTNVFTEKDYSARVEPACPRFAR